jgi:hypothetical protein
MLLKGLSSFLMTSHRHRRLLIHTSLTLCVFLATLLPEPGVAAEQDATIYLQPHCESEVSNCNEFQIESPDMIRTLPLMEGSIIDMDLVIANPSLQPVSRIRTWLAYDPTVLQGELLEIDDAFPLITPGEADFNAEDGYVQIEASVFPGSAPATELITVARIQMKILKIPAGQETAITFHDIQQGGHTAIFTETDGREEYILGIDPGVLHIMFEDPAGSIPSQETDPVEPTIPPAENTTTDPAEEEFLFPNGQACIRSTQCRSGLCAHNICQSQTDIPVEPDVQEPTVTEPLETTGTEDPVTAFGTDDLVRPPSMEMPKERTTFVLLQVRNVRATTEGSTIFLAWDPLASSVLKGYNVYYGTISGQYIQRRTIDSSSHGITLRGLPTGTTYYLAVRAINESDEESAFSQEVAITVGDPGSSTSLLLLSDFDNPTVQNPLPSDGYVPGETGASSTLVFLILISAGIGTVLAWRRQIAVQQAR